MTQRLMLLGIVLLALTGCSAATPTAGRSAPNARGGRGPAMAAARTSPAPAADQQKLVIPVQLPPAGQARPMTGPGMSGHGPDCPQTQVSGLLGVQIGQPHGVILAHVSPQGPAGKAGLKAGDSIIECNGVAVTCPATLLPKLRTGDKTTTAKLTVLRAKSSTAPAPVAKPAPSSKPAAKGTRKPAPAKKPSRNTNNQNQAKK